jgi:FkbH-like protein
MFFLKINDMLGRFSSFLASLFSFREPHLNFYGRYIWYKHVLHRKIFAKHNWRPNLFYIKCYLKNRESTNLLVQIDNKRQVKLTKIFKLNEGVNELSIPIRGELDGSENYRVFLTPLEEKNTIITFTWLDLLEIDDIKIPTHSKKIKLVAWDLDNTLWNGTLVENDAVEINEDAIKVIKELDRRGIINVILSKNNFEQAISKLKELGIEQYFVSFAINWGQKSENLKLVAERLNLGIDSFAFIDDNVRERLDMNEALPEVRVYDVCEISQLLAYQEFDVPITEESANRRKSYQNENNRQEYKAKFNDDYDAFLKNLDMSLLVVPVNDSNSNRCFELLSRSNQLNLSTNRYTEQEYNSLVQDDNNLCLAFRCRDKFGDYGLISFISLRFIDSEIEILDFVISCRVARKKVEDAIILSLKPILLRRGIKSISAKLIRTNKNYPIEDVFNNLPFEIKEKNDKYVLYFMSDINVLNQQDIISVDYEL